MKKAAVCIPTYNEKENIIKIIEAVHSEIPHADILIVDDSSPDKTAEIVNEFMKDNDYVSVKVRNAKEGLGAAYLDGFETLIERGYERIIQMDADFSHKPEYLPEMLSKMDEGYDLIIGSRYVKGGGTRNWNIIRRTVSRGGSLYASTILGLGVNDVTAGFKCWDAGLLQKVTSTPLVLSGFGFQIEMAFRSKIAKAKIHELAIIFPDREEGESKMSGKIFKEALFGVWKLRMIGKKILKK